MTRASRAYGTKTVGSARRPVMALYYLRLSRKGLTMMTMTMMRQTLTLTLRQRRLMRNRQAHRPSRQQRLPQELVPGRAPSGSHPCRQRGQHPPLQPEVNLVGGRGGQGRVGHPSRANDVVADRFAWILLDQGHMLVRRSVEDDVRAPTFQGVFDAVGVCDVSEGRDDLKVTKGLAQLP